PLTNSEGRGCVHSARGVRSCGGERPGRPPARGRSSAGHLGPDEAGQLAGHRGDRDGSGLADISIKTYLKHWIFVSSALRGVSPLSTRQQKAGPSTLAMRLALTRSVAKS